MSGGAPVGSKENGRHARYPIQGRLPVMVWGSGMDVEVTSGRWIRLMTMSIFDEAAIRSSGKREAISEGFWGEEKR